MYRLLPLAMLAAAACDKPGVTVDFRHKQGEPGKAVATWNGDQFTDAELKARFSEMNPYQRARYQTLEARKEYVEGLARFEILAQEAQRRGIANDPDVVDTAKK